jgi:DNA polymerase elongation subunit (family B)
MLDKLSLQNILFIDIETVPEVYEYSALCGEIKNLWDKKMQYQKTEQESFESLYKKAGIFAEFAKVVCISMAIIEKSANTKSIYIHSLYGDDEKKLLRDFKEQLWTRFNKKNLMLCAHNGKEFDFPFLARRMLIHGIKLPPALNNAGKKPWEINHLDTLDLWKFGDYKHYTSLDLLASVFKIPSPKSDMDGSLVASEYWEKNNLSRIVNYCQNDVLTLAQVLLCFKGEKMIEAKDVFVVA